MLDEQPDQKDSKNQPERERVLEQVVSESPIHQQEQKYQQCQDELTQKQQLEQSPDFTHLKRAKA